jgi:hypothetical protein
MEGEAPGTIGDDIIVQTIVADYLVSLEEPYDASIQGRLVNRTDILEPMNLIQTVDSCQVGEYWVEGVFSCAACPMDPTVTFLQEKLEFEGDESLEANTLTKYIPLVNAALFDVAILVKSLPSWVKVTSAVFEKSSRTVDLQPGSASVQILSGDTLVIGFQVEFGSLEPGTAQGTIALGVFDGGNFLGCAGRDATFDIFARKFPAENLHQLGSIRIVGWVLGGITVLASLGLIAWVVFYRNLQVVRTLQPVFLVMISIGVFIMALALFPLAIDDEIASDELCDTACMSAPWLLSMGFTITFSALFSKLRRINRLFEASLRRVKVQVRHVVAPFAILFTLNLTALLVWTLLSPLRWQRVFIDGEPWKSYGICRSNNETVGGIMFGVVAVLNIASLIFASYEGYRARNISDEFAESKSVGLALFCWVQSLLLLFRCFS